VRALDPISLALDHITKLDKLREEALAVSKSKELSMRGVVSRMKNFPTLLAQVGLIPALTFYLSKLDDNGINEKQVMELIDYFSHGTRVSEPGSLIEEMSEKEGKGYVIAFAMLVSALSMFATQKFGTLNDIVGELKNLISNYPKRRKVEKLITIYSMEMKKLCEAYGNVKWTKDGEEGKK